MTNLVLELVILLKNLSTIFSISIVLTVYSRPQEQGEDQMHITRTDSRIRPVKPYKLNMA